MPMKKMVVAEAGDTWTATSYGSADIAKAVSKLTPDQAKQLRGILGSITRDVTKIEKSAFAANEKLDDLDLPDDVYNVFSDALVLMESGATDVRRTIGVLK